MPKASGKISRRWRAVAIALLLVLAPAISILPASAQEQQVRRPTLLEMIFGPRRAEPQRQLPPKAVRVPRKRTTRSVTTITSQPTAPVVAPVEKLATARSILVVGDFLAGGLADGLTEAFVDAPGAMVVGRSNGSSGLVREDYYDWKAQLPTLIEEIKPAAVVISIGANDRQQMTSTPNREKFRTEEWFSAYEKRVTALAQVAISRKIPLLWVGIPAFKSPLMTSDAIKLNSIYRNGVEKAGGEFIDIWDGFVDQDGRFVITGSDINGQQVRLRSADGVGMTKAGKRKMAFYVEKSVRRLLGDMASPELLRLDASNLPQLLSFPPSEINAVVMTQPINLGDPDLDGGTALLGGGPQSGTEPISSPRDRLVRNGDVGPAPAGRVDDFRIVQTGSTPALK